MATAHSIPARRKPRVMLFTDSFIHGGTERQFVTTLRSLDRSRYDVRVGCLKRRGPFLADVEAMGIAIEEFPIQSLYGLDTARRFFRLVHYLRREKIDVLHAFDFYTNIFVVPAARLAGVPVVIASQRNLAHSRSDIECFALGMGCRMAHQIVANSQAAVRVVLGLGGRESRISVIHNTIDAGEYRSVEHGVQLRARLGLPQHGVLVGVVAALRPEKGHRTFLHAAAIARQAGCPAQFVVVGDGSEREAVAAAVRELGVTECVVLAGAQQNVADWFHALDIVVLPSDFESLPNAVLEAMAAGKPVIASNVGGTPELVTHGTTGYLVPVRDAGAMAQRIVELAADESLRHRMGEAGRARAEREFTPAKMTQQLQGLYDRLLRRNKPTARILQIGNFPPPVCGWALHTQLLDRELLERGADARVMDIGPGRRVAGRDCIPTHNGWDYFAKLLLYRMRGFTFHMHVNGDSWKGYVLALAAVLLGRVTGKPAVLTFHAGPAQMYFPRASGFWRAAFALLFRSSGRVICNHEPVKTAIAAYGVPAGKIHPIPAYSVQYSEEIPVPLVLATEEFIRAHSPMLFSYSLFRPEFTMPALFEAFASVRRAHPGAGLLIAGPQQAPADAAQQMRELGIADAIHIPGNMPHAQFLTTIQRSDVFVRTHLRDGVCTSVLEALQLGVPVVAAEDGLRPASVITYAPGDAAALARALNGVLADLAAVRAKVRPPAVDNNLDQEIAVLLDAGGAAAEV